MFVTKDSATTFWRGQRLERTIVGLTILFISMLIGELLLIPLVGASAATVFTTVCAVVSASFFLVAILLPAPGHLPFFVRKYEECKWALQRKVLPARSCSYKNAAAYDRWIGGSFRQIYNADMILIATMTTHNWDQGQQVVEFLDIQNGPKLPLLARTLTTARYS